MNRLSCTVYITICTFVHYSLYMCNLYNSYNLQIAKVSLSSLLTVFIPTLGVEGLDVEWQAYNKNLVNIEHVNTSFKTIE